MTSFQVGAAPESWSKYTTYELWTFLNEKKHCCTSIQVSLTLQVNPPYHCPMVELVPAPWTSEQTRAQARSIIQSVGQTPVSLAKEMPGFILNRMQYALLNECWRLVSLVLSCLVYSVLVFIGTKSSREPQLAN